MVPGLATKMQRIISSVGRIQIKSAALFQLCGFKTLNLCLFYFLGDGGGVINTYSTDRKFKQMG